MTNSRAGRLVRILVSTACLALVLASCGSGDDDAVAQTYPPTYMAAEPDAPVDSAPLVQNVSSLSLREAAAVAVKAVKGSSLLVIETEPGRTVWEATVVKRNGTEHEMLISMSDGSLIDGPTKKFDDFEDMAENRALISESDLGYKKAARAIRDAVPEARLTELNLGTFDDHRFTVWEGDLYGADGMRYKVTIAAKSGDVIEKDADADDDD
ncbi:PepSY domain-containing protein [Aeromicrobium sp.]|uniref:PepSY domain-containing protein n=1 Tax=Aeromicrobium sp. TaxID=1871063 RepID=UPI003D6AFB47